MKKTIIVVLMMLYAFISLHSEEGMWTLDQLEKLNLKKKGLKISISEIYNPNGISLTNAIVLLGGGTSELISENGLLLTNHHVAFGAVQRASTKGKDYLTNGFLAKNYGEEIQGHGTSASLLQYSKDISKIILKTGSELKDPLEREKARERKIKEITDKIEKGKFDIKASVAKMYSGKQYVLEVYKRFDDVRVVFMPPGAIGNYGGDIDNWMWPRHTGDFAFMRIYMAPDGSGRKYNKENIPYKAKKWLKIAKDGLKDGDFTFIMGYPGFTTRYRTSNSLLYTLDLYYPNAIKIFKETINILEKVGNKSKITKIKVSGLSKGLNNAMKNWQGKIDGMHRTDFINKRMKFENELMEFLKKDKNLYKKYGKVLDRIKSEYEKKRKTYVYDLNLGLGTRLNGTLMGIASSIYGTVMERAKPKKERNPSFSEKSIKRMVSRLHYGYMSYDESADKALFKAGLRRLNILKGDQRIKGLEFILKGGNTAIDKFVDDAFSKTKLNDVNFAKKLFYEKQKELLSINDPLINLASKLYPETEVLRKRNEKFSAVITELRKDYINALYAWKGSNMYPDANRTIRFTYGAVEGYNPKDAVSYAPFTTLKGVIEKDTGKKPFDMPSKLEDLYNKKDFGQWCSKTLKDVPVAFTHKCDITGGNSGSPVMNSKGELIGIAFDGNYEAMTGDMQYDPKLQRTISVDIRYVMFITEKFAKATNILKELGF